MEHALFVYGSLRSECDNLHARLLRRQAALQGRATVRGSLFRVGAYPGYRKKPNGIVHGELWRLRDAEKALAELDEYEGDEYSRMIVAASPDTPGDINAWIYLYRRDVSAAARILSGDFLAP